MTLFAYDVQQVFRWTERQKEGILFFLKLPRWADFTNSTFAYSEVPYEGGPVVVTAPTGEQRTFYEDGSVANDLSGVH